MRSSVVAAMALALVACSDDTSGLATTFTSTMLGQWEKPNPVITDASGTATCTIGPSPNIQCDVTYSGLSGAPSASHIHLGAASTTGLVRVNLCGTGAPAPACPASGTFSSGPQPAIPTGTQTAAQAYDAVVAAMRSFGAYVNVHTGANTGGEIRGQLLRAN